MKKLLLALVIILGSGILQAQIVITNNDILGSGSTVIQAVDTLPAGTIGPGLAGPNQVWDFSTLHEDWVDTIKFLQPDWTPYGSLFPDANFALLQLGLDSMYVMFYRDNSELSVIGMVWKMEELSDTTIIIRVNPKMKVAEFPVAYGDIRSDTSTFKFTIPGPTPPVDSVRMQFTTIADIEVDAWGSITIPIGTYEALRVHEHQVQLDCTFLYIVGQWNFQEVEIDTTDMYTWWSNDDEAGFYLAEMEMRSDLKGIVDNVIFLKAKPTQGVAEEAETNAITVYPNPAESYVIIETGSGFTGRIEIRTMLGKTCKTMVCNGSGQQRIALYDLPSGIYLYTVRGSNSSSIYSGKFVKR